MRRVVAVVAALLSIAAVRYISIGYKVEDRPDERVLRLSYQNNTRSNVCIGPENWPSAGGILNTTGAEVYIDIGANRYFLEQHQEYCPKCLTSVGPGQTVEGRLKYEDFGIPASEFDKPKVLHMNSIGYACSSTHDRTRRLR
jgi:hypothetical protein